MAEGERAQGTLYVVATPIGNLGDITLRALEVLRAAPLVAAEDTRMTRRLWARHGIATRLISYHAQSGIRRRDELLAHLAGGADLAIVTDAGTPLVSDPGEELVAAWAARGGRVVPIPGASAVLAALVASGLPAARWCFEG
ncbi:MAG TPA: SAM-dependent methyltransferase, partial [Candidatus Limnocylindrales bacterium]|nr:SAM-dependent methyltransferase [Candidatus Limnocylindrales bacterium]